MSKLSDFHGIDSQHVRKLQECGVTSNASLLRLAGTISGRRNLQSQTGISSRMLKKWADRADLARVYGIGQEHIELLAAAGVDSLSALTQQNGTILHATLARLNADSTAALDTPSESAVIRWVTRAKGMDSLVQS